jgi:hypothetical protein
MHGGNGLLTWGNGLLVWREWGSCMAGMVYLHGGNGLLA